MTSWETVLYLYWRTLLTNATFPEIIIDTRRVSLRGEDGVPWRDRWAFHLNSKTFLITNVVDSLKESCVSMNCSTKLNNWPDDLSVMLEPPTGRMVEPEEEVIALKWNNFSNPFLDERCTHCLLLFIVLLLSCEKAGHTCSSQHGCHHHN